MSSMSGNATVSSILDATCAVRMHESGKHIPVGISSARPWARPRAPAPRPRCPDQTRRTGPQQGTAPNLPEPVTDEPVQRRHARPRTRTRRPATYTAEGACNGITTRTASMHKAFKERVRSDLRHNEQHGPGAGAAFFAHFCAEGGRRIGIVHCAMSLNCGALGA